jgi:glutathione S-transferase
MQGIDFQPVQIDLSRKPGYYSRVSSSGLVPAVAFEGRNITESLDICHWVDRSFDGPALVPDDKQRQNTMEDLISSASRISSAGLDLLSGRTGRSVIHVTLLVT